MGDAGSGRRKPPAGGGQRGAAEGGRGGKGARGKAADGKGGQRGGSPARDHGRGGPRRDGVDETVAQLAKPLQRVLARLPETQRRVLELRMGLVDGHPHDLADTARALGLSMGEAREIEQRAFDHIREVVPLSQLQRFLDR